MNDRRLSLRESSVLERHVYGAEDDDHREEVNNSQPICQGTGSVVIEVKRFHFDPVQHASCSIDYIGNSDNWPLTTTLFTNDPETCHPTALVLSTRASALAERGDTLACGSSHSIHQGHANFGFLHRLTIDHVDSSSITFT